MQASSPFAGRVMIGDGRSDERRRQQDSKFQ